MCLIRLGGLSNWSCAQVEALDIQVKTIMMLIGIVRTKLKDQIN